MGEKELRRENRKLEIKSLAKIKKASLTRDLKTLSATELKEKYGMTYDSWKNSKSRAKKRGNWDPEFEEFRDFLRHMGPRTDKKLTLDRIDNTNPKYGPGLCRWADKRTQATNRSTTRQVSEGADLRPLPEVARERGISPDALRKQRKRQGLDQFPQDPRQHRPWPKPHDPEAQRWWEEQFQASGGIKRWSSRYEFLIADLRQKIDATRAYLNADYSDCPEDAPTPEQATSKRGYLARAKKELDRAIKEEPLWNRAMDLYLNREHEKKVIRVGWSDVRDEPYRHGRGGGINRTDDDDT